MRSLLAQLLLLRKRTSIWVLFGVWSAALLLFQYILPYWAYTDNRNFEHRGGFALLLAVLPQNMISNVMTSVFFYGGLVVLIVAVLAMGSEYTWGTLTPVFTQRDSRLRVFFSKMAAIGIALIPFVIVVFVLGALASVLIAWREGQIIDFPGAWDIAKAMGTGWFIMALWATFGVIISVLSRGTALAVGLGILYGLVFENIITALGNEVDLLQTISKGFLRTNTYSIISALGFSPVSQGGPGGFAGPAVSGTFSAFVVAGYIILFLGLSAFIIRSRDVAGAG